MTGFERIFESNRQERTTYPMWTFCAHTQRPIGRLRWWLLPHIGYYCDGTEHWRWWMRPARWMWIALGWLPASGIFVSKKEWRRIVDELPADPVRIPTKEEISSAHAARIERGIILGPEDD